MGDSGREIERGPRLIPDEMLHATIGGRATEERDASGKILARLQPDGLPLLGAARPSLTNLVAGFDKSASIRSGREIRSGQLRVSEQVWLP